MDTPDSPRTTTHNATSTLDVKTYDPAVLAGLAAIHPEVAALIAQLDFANAILRSEALMWLRAGSNHERFQLNWVIEASRKYCDRYGSWGGLTPQDIRNRDYQLLVDHQTKHHDPKTSQILRSLCPHCTPAGTSSL